MWHCFNRIIYSKYWWDSKEDVSSFFGIDFCWAEIHSLLRFLYQEMLNLPNAYKHNSVEKCRQFFVPTYLDMQQTSSNLIDCYMNWTYWFDSCNCWNGHLIEMICNSMNLYICIWFRKSISSNYSTLKYFVHILVIGISLFLKFTFHINVQQQVIVFYLNWHIEHLSFETVSIAW